MDLNNTTPIITSMPPLYPAFVPGVFESMQEGNEFLDSLDSDTRDYVVKHKDTFNSKDELISFVNKLNGNSQ